MERTTFSLLFYIRRDKLNKRGEAPVFMRLTINGERADASIKRFIEPHAWNSDKGKANEKCRGGKDLNLYLNAISANILQIQRAPRAGGLPAAAARHRMAAARPDGGGRGAVPPRTALPRRRDRGFR
nr:Arm DNA-binding domain-containing protein [uncultured Alistipes sp.]